MKIEIHPLHSSHLVQAIEKLRKTHAWVSVTYTKRHVVLEAR